MKKVILIDSGILYLAAAPWVGRAAVDDILSRRTDLTVRVEGVAVLVSAVVWMFASFSLIREAFFPAPRFDEAARAVAFMRSSAAKSRPSAGALLRLSEESVPAAGLLGVLVGLIALVLVSSSGGPRNFDRIWMVVTFALLSLGCLLIKGRATGRVLSGFSKILVYGGVSLWAAFQFWYANQYAPSHNAVVLNVETKLEKVESHVPGLTALSATVKISNPGDSRATILASEYTISGFTTSVRTSPSPTPPPTADISGFDYEQRQDPQVRRFSRLTEESQGEVFQTAEFLSNGSQLEPGETIVRTYVAYVPSDSGLLRLEASVAAANAANISLGQPIFGPIPFSGKRALGGHAVLSLTEVHQPSALARLASRPAGVLVKYVLGSHPTKANASLYWGPESPEEARSPKRAHVSQITVTSSTYEMVLPAASPSPSPTPTATQRGRARLSRSGG